MKNQFSLTTLITIALSVWGSGLATAGTATTTFPVSITATTACSVTATGLDFGTFVPGPTSPAVSGTGTVTVTCALNVPYKVALDRGLHGGTGGRKLQFANGTTMTYEIYQDSSKTVVWGDNDLANTYPPGASLAGTGSGVAQPLTVHGMVPTGQNPTVPPSFPEGVDTITVTVVF